MRALLRVLTVASFAGFLVTAALAFSVRVSAEPNGLDGGRLDAGVLSTVFGRTGLEPQGFSSSKAFGGSIAPPGSGFGGLGVRGGLGAATGIGRRRLGRAGVTVVDMSISGPLARNDVELAVSRVVGVHFGKEPCVAEVGTFEAVLEVTKAGTVARVRSNALEDAGRPQGVGCVEDDLREAKFTAANAPSTIRVSLRFHHLE